MTHMTRLDELLYEMTRYDDKDVKRIQHFLKVHEFARLIGLAENLDPYPGGSGGSGHRS